MRPMDRSLAYTAATCGWCAYAYRLHAVIFGEAQFAYGGAEIFSQNQRLAEMPRLVTAWLDEKPEDLTSRLVR